MNYVQNERRFIHIKNVKKADKRYLYTELYTLSTSLDKDLQGKKLCQAKLMFCEVLIKSLNSAAKCKTTVDRRNVKNK